jgi:hypothetical protein
MNRNEFCSLPIHIALGLLYDANHATICTLPVPNATPATSTSTPAPSGDVRPPRFDARVPRRGGFVYASEMLLADLEWWHTKKIEGARAGGQYAAKDQRLADELARFIAWRRVAPAETWHGVRGQKTVTAEPPRRDPVLRSWADRAPAKLAPPPPAGGYGDADYAASGDDEIPF